ncbi:ATP-binding protein [Streptomyces sp. NPDC048636]|uniref:ATP-binding protein n=1 Tax=Streptomyces sp. NPDC048636 TaxID=3155762 RepID=UPI0034203235
MTLPPPGPLDLAPGTLLVAVGPGAAGKSTYAGTAAVVAVICLDTLRREIGGDEGDQSITPVAVARQNALLEQYLTTGITVFLDSTNVEAHVRAGLVKRARRHGRPIVALRILPDLDTCLERNRIRPANRRVPPDTLRWQHALAAEATPQTLLAEGFTAVHDIDTGLRSAEGEPCRMIISTGKGDSMPNNDGISITGHLDPYEWSDEETASYEAAIEAVNGAVGAYSAVIAAEEAKPEPDQGIIAKARQEQNRLARERELLRSTDPWQIAAARRRYAELAREVLAGIS